ncbi:hypothetical protein Taro_023391, partial [Colocasia esculenta]|nr:hypothetical protein [Colocasia esculenta]
LWTVCHLLRDRRAQEAAAAGGDLAKVLLLMQTYCSPATRQMGVNLLKILRGNSKDEHPSSDSKTIHITPF